MLNPKEETATVVNANIPGAANIIIQSVIFIVAANTDSKKETMGLFISPTLDKANEKINAKKIIGIISPFASDSKGFCGIMLRNKLPICPFCCAITLLT